MSFSRSMNVLEPAISLTGFSKICDETVDLNGFEESFAVSVDFDLKLNFFLGRKFFSVSFISWDISSIIP